MIKPQGRRGEVAAELFTDFPERFAERRRVFVLAAGGSRREMRLEDFWPHQGRMVLKFAGIESIEDAEALRGCEVQIPASERAPLEPGSAYVADLVGCAVLDAGREIGRLRDVQFGAGEAPLLVIDGPGGRELLVPFAEAYLESFDAAGKSLRLQLPDGMLDLDQPLSEEEKKRQHGEGN